MKVHISKIRSCKTVSSTSLPSDVGLICYTTDVYECLELKRALRVGVGWEMSESFPSLPKIIKKNPKTPTGFEIKHAIICTLLPSLPT